MNNIELEYIKKYISLDGVKMTDQNINKIKNLIKKGKLPKPGGDYDYLMGNKMLNLKKDPRDSRDYLFESIQPLKHSSVNWQSTMSPIKDQGRLGSCVGFAVAAMKEWQEQREHEQEVIEGKRDHRDEKHYDLSEQWIYYMSKKIDPWPGQEGTSIRCAMKVLQRIGVPCEDAWPYSDVKVGKPKKWANLVARWSLIDSYQRINNLQELKTALQLGPVVIGVPCFEEIFYVESDGIIQYPKNPDVIYGGHAICAVGYNDKSGYVQFKNSWSDSWGRRGYGFLPYKYIEDFLWDAWSCKDLGVTTEMLKGTRELITQKQGILKGIFKRK